MQLSQIPAKFLKAFAANAAAGNIRAIPLNSSDPDAASQTVGWPPSTFTPEGAGGVPPDGRDMNGVMNQMSAWNQWQAAGGAFVPYDSAFQTAIGGYPNLAIIGSVSNPGTYWQSTVDNNATNPDTGGGGWVAWPTTGSIPWSSPPPIGTGTPNLGKFTNLSTTGFINAAAYVNAGTDLQINGVGFSQSFGTSSYQRLPSGLIIQSGRFFSSSGNGDTISFPLSFPTNCTLVASAGTTGSGSRNEVNVEISGPSFGSFQCWTWHNGSITAGIGVGWIAIGN